MLDENEASHNGTKSSKPCEEKPCEEKDDEKENLPLRPVRGGGQNPPHPALQNQSFVLNAPSARKTEPALQQRTTEGEKEIFREAAKK